MPTKAFLTFLLPGFRLIKVRAAGIEQPADQTEFCDPYCIAAQNTQQREQQSQKTTGNVGVCTGQSETGEREGLRSTYHNSRDVREEICVVIEHGLVPPTGPERPAKYSLTGPPRSPPGRY